MVNQRRYKRGKKTHRHKTRRVKRSRVKRSRVKRSRVKRTKMRGGYPGEEMYNRFKNRIKVGDFVKPLEDGLVKNIDFTNAKLNDNDIPKTMPFDVVGDKFKFTGPDKGRYLRIKRRNVEDSDIYLLKESYSRKFETTTSFPGNHSMVRNPVNQ